jgi:8-oxo-dGTP diphosphatase
MPQHCYDFPRPMVTCDVVLFRHRAGAVETLLIKRKHEPFVGRWAIPGGFVNEEERLAAAALRELCEETAIRRVRLREFAVFGDPGRDPRGRTITVVYYALLGPGRGDAEARAGDDAAEARWFSILRPPRALAFDHAKILAAARVQLWEDFRNTPAAFRLLPRTFTLDELAELFEDVRGKKLDRRSFRRRVLALGCLQPAEDLQYRFDARRFRALRADGRAFPDF